MRADITAQCPRCGEAIADQQPVPSLDDEVICGACRFVFILREGLIEAAVDTAVRNHERRTRPVPGPRSRK